MSGDVEPLYAVPEFGLLYPSVRGTPGRLSDDRFQTTDCPVCHRGHLLSQMRQTLGPFSRVYFCPDSTDAIVCARVDRDGAGWAWALVEGFAIDEIL